ncbi:4-hydroxy-tetrahydrodipicolinate synthase [Gluconacetobacter takamatsuzukensis]|uniref:4-hydroxy-tetrahydrodipicolinate synthase n=1 Tax=Gluconacetobacter takamatsuzukensis TaxID=1286190 RepID=A0A7W4KCM3_9PROT|nr:4-hydroxy-tetrahydrodipicolinate synthase [Gluconacetobacter takamatsuzukensis]MBB2204463.1 4-hydroxy-tetrahydrodipicolinate synthase [Gluconacetobacter takamatsuzukensis]
MFKGSITALITPMNDDGSLDFPALGRFLDWQVTEGSSGVVPMGTTGESPTLTHDEHARVVEYTVQLVAGRVPVIAGAGSNSTAEAVAMARHAKAAGADAVLVVAPYYNKPTQEGLYRHFMAVADATDLPLVVYNIPGRSVVEVSVETMARLARHARIIGVKDATANLLRPIQVRRAIGHKPFNQLSGEDGTVVSFLAAGGDGCISVTSNVAPRLCAELHRAWQDGRVADAMALQDRLSPLHDALFCESNPGPVKYAASLLGLAGETCRLPLAPLTDESRTKVREALAAVGLLN